jgi:hypothetical protein
VTADTDLDALYRLLHRTNLAAVGNFLAVELRRTARSLAEVDPATAERMVEAAGEVAEEMGRLSVQYGV